MVSENEIAYKYIQDSIADGENKLSKIDILDLLDGLGKPLNIHPQKIVMMIAEYTKK